MTLDITEQEKELLLETLKSGHRSLLDELHHTENYDYKQMLRQKDKLLKELTARVEALASK